MGRWVLVSQKSAEILAVHAALLHNNKILYFSGDEHDKGQNERHENNHTRLFDCSTFAITNPGSPPQDLFCCGQALTADGNLLVAGGTEAFDRVAGEHHDGHFIGIREASVFVTGEGRWRTTGPLNFEPGRVTGGGRWYPTLVTLPSGEIVALSGHPRRDDTRHQNYAIEAWRPGRESWEFLSAGEAASAFSDLYPRVHVLPNGKLFSSTPVGGRTRQFNLASRAWEDSGLPASGDYLGFKTSSVLLPLLPEEGYRARVLITGTSQTYIRDLGAAAPSWRLTTSRALAGNPIRNNSTPVLLLNGEVLVCGGVSGEQDSTNVRTTEIYNPFTRRWRTDATATVVRNYHSVALLMPDGRVWTAGSNFNAARSNLAIGNDQRELRLELYEPSYFSEPRLEIISYPGHINYGVGAEVRLTQSPRRVSRVALIRTGSVTHSFNSDQRYVGIEFEMIAPNVIRIKTPPNANIAPPGYYLLCVMDERGIPSKGKFIRLDRV